MELNLDLSLNYLPKKVSEILEQVSVCNNKDDKFAILDDYVKRLQDELKKIEAFKRELPLCMLLLNDVIARLKDEMKHYSEACNEKKEWMSSAQLWTSNFDYEAQQRSRVEQQEDRSVPDNPIQQQERSSRRGEVFVPFKVNSVCARKDDDKEGSPVPSLSLMTPMFDLDSSCKSGGETRRVRSSELVLQRRTNQELQQQQQGFRKQRRCWSPELHRRFVEALQQLGGSQAATPKQIRELMQVDGLTNDEVKSHLQKYRLHMRRLPASSTAAITDVWMAPDRNGDHHKTNISQSNSPQGPLPTSGSGKGISSVGYDSMDAEEDERSEVHSWEAGLHKAV